ncbi:MAG TPA: hypothetical protein VES67_24130 [Vicinamibacterales bacterium]|nr:hypothetical protein [Vicinamibacterales bacterium]
MRIVGLTSMVGFLVLVARPAARASFVCYDGDFGPGDFDETPETIATLFEPDAADVGVGDRAEQLRFLELDHHSIGAMPETPAPAAKRGRKDRI